MLILVKLLLFVIQKRQEPIVVTRLFCVENFYQVFIRNFFLINALHCSNSMQLNMFHFVYMAAITASDLLQYLVFLEKYSSLVRVLSSSLSGQLPYGHIIEKSLLNRNTFFHFLLTMTSKKIFKYLDLKTGYVFPSLFI